jgi:ankyrin repeat protein
MIPPPLSLSSISFSPAKFVQRVLALGPEFLRYGAALDEKKTVDCTFLQKLTDREIDILFAFIPQVHQVKLKSLLPQNVKASLAHNSDDGILSHKSSVKTAQTGSRINFEDGSGISNGEEKSGDEAPKTAAKKRKKKKKNKIKTATAPPPVKITATAPPPVQISQEDLDTMADLDRWLSRGAPLTKKSALRTDLLVRAATVGHVEAVKMLVEKPGIRVLLESPLGPGNKMVTALHMAAFRGTATSLYMASQNGHSEVVKCLLDAGTDKEAANPNGSTSLYIASQNGHLEVVTFLIDAGADKEATKDGFISIHVASKNGHHEVVKKLLDAGVNKEVRTSKGSTSLHVASEYGHPDVVKILLDAGAGTEETMPDGSTSLYVASKLGHADVVKVLLDAGADKEATKSGFTSLHVASKNGHPDVAKLLLRAGADKEAAQSGRTPLFFASQYGHPEVAQILLDAGADKKTVKLGGAAQIAKAK